MYYLYKIWARRGHERDWLVVLLISNQSVLKSSRIGRSPTKADGFVLPGRFWNNLKTEPSLLGNATDSFNS